ncbi:phosducin-like protein 3 [Salvelinus namaycush]|uniref:Phosducin-like protein 3 n=1 Tax=Salvelinus namaycush TaxID=8040 RepID=A0A8U0QAQ1_SALNM|nr:phosducin-like protein 3 [Salvelinus namaycush]
MQQANENQARRDRSCFESLTLWDLKNPNHNPPLWVVKDREEDVEYQERSESEEGDEEEEEEYVCVIIEGSEVEEDEEEEEEEYEVTGVGEYVEEEEEEYEVTGVGEYVEEEEEEEEECLLEVVVKEEEVEEDEEERVETYEKEKGLKLSVNGLRGRQTGEEKYGQLREILGDQYVREVTCAPEGDRVVLHLYHPSHLATKFPECKFLMILAGQCVPNYPASHLPTLFIYDSGCILNSLIGEKACGGRNVLEDELKWMLAQSGAFVIDSYEALYQEGTPITTPRSEQEQEDYRDDQSDHDDNQGTEV